MYRITASYDDVHGPESDQLVATVDNYIDATDEAYAYVDEVNHFIEHEHTKWNNHIIVCDGGLTITIARVVVA